MIAEYRNLRFVLGIIVHSKIVPDNYIFTKKNTITPAIEGLNHTKGGVKTGINQVVKLKKKR
jgi:hypothetical protein